MIEKTLDSDMGVYECMAKSPLGEVKSRPARMDKQKPGKGKIFDFA